MKPVMDETMATFVDEIQDLIDRIDDLIAKPDPAAEQRLIADIDAMKRDVNAELIARNPPPGWSLLEDKMGRVVQ